MTEHSLWRFPRAWHRAINDRQLEDIASLLDDEVEFAIYGPIDLFPFFGSRQGKAAVLEVIRQIADNVRVHRFDREDRKSTRLNSSHQIISYAVFCLKKKMKSEI